ncbi:Integral membrane protein [Tritrichomonas foetus]|uniref:Integral membrane protein n=1 Tax=Tritrichomonas foetus TaxID=1144522 RepID=A0A1J4JZB6_9EUKA|nr:Integral membrane protein [Tritrichomonas foetus]|eukprot:OHT04519.1 Integral membrane protein [Tritrichomonas foetus]
MSNHDRKRDRYSKYSIQFLSMSFSIFLFSRIMKCTPTTAFIFVLDAILYGSSYAGVAQGLKYFSAGVFQTFRMLFGCLLMFLVVVIRCTFSKEYRNFIKLHFTQGVMPVVNILIGGLLNMAIPHCLTAVAQGWVASSVVQIFQPFIPLFGAIVSHFFIPEERFTCQVAISLALALIGIVLSSIPSFLHGTDGGGSVGYVALGYTLTLFAMASFGIAPVFFKLKTPNVDESLSVCLQLAISTVFEAIYGLITDGPKSFADQVNNAPPIGWMWPVVIGALVSGVAVFCVMYLIRTIGVFGTNLVPFGQLIVGLIVGVAILDEWNGFKPWEIALNVIGILILCGSLFVGIYKKKEKKLDTVSSSSSSMDSKYEDDHDSKSESSRGSSEIDEREDREINEI